MKKIKQFLAGFKEKHPLLIFIISVSLWFGYVLMENSTKLWLNYHHDGTKTAYYLYSAGEIMALGGFLLFPWGIVLAKSKRMFSEYWLAIIAEAVIVASLAYCGIDRPLCDDNYYDRPLLLILRDSSILFLVEAIIQGPLLIAAYFIFSDKQKPKRTIKRHIFTTLPAVSLSVFLVFSAHYFLSNAC